MFQTRSKIRLQNVIRNRMTRENIQATGNFLATYHSDLTYIQNFHRYKSDQLSTTDYTAKDTGTFYSFVIEFKIVRNFSKGSVDKLLKETIKWVDGRHADNVDLFADRLRKAGLTRGHTMTSLASKILFLNNPWTILPMDSLVRQVLNQKDKLYSNYAVNLLTFKKANRDTIDKCLRHAAPLTAIIEKDFKIKNIKTIATNRLVDKLLWTAGK